MQVGSEESRVGRNIPSLLLLLAPLGPPGPLAGSLCSLRDKDAMREVGKFAQTQGEFVLQQHRKSRKPEQTHFCWDSFPMLHLEGLGKG